MPAAFLAALFLAVAGTVAGAPEAGAQEPGAPALQVAVERTDAAGQSSLWVPLRVTVTEDGRPYTPEHVVFVVARDPAGTVTEPFGLKVLELDTPEAAPGVHEGFVIVRHGGPWTLTANANKVVADDDAPPIILGRGTLDVTVDGPAPTPAGLASAAGTPAGAGKDGGNADKVGVTVLWLHTMVAIGWGVAVALLTVLALPAGRRLLSEAGSNLLDGRLDRIVRATWWLTGLVVATGTYNLVTSVAYRVPLTPDQARRLFDLPYAEPYYLTLAAKLAAYAVMIGATVPLVGEARRRAALAARLPSDVNFGPDDDSSPWDDPTRLAPAPPGGRLAVRARPAETAVPLTGAAEGRSFNGTTGLLVAGGFTIVAAVTLLKYLHLLAEVSRLGG